MKGDSWSFGYEQNKVIYEVTLSCEKRQRDSKKRRDPSDLKDPNKYILNGIFNRFLIFFNWFLFRRSLTNVVGLPTRAVIVDVASKTRWINSGIMNSVFQIQGNLEIIRGHAKVWKDFLSYERAFLIPETVEMSYKNPSIHQTIKLLIHRICGIIKVVQTISSQNCIHFSLWEKQTVHKQNKWSLYRTTKCPKDNGVVLRTMNNFWACQN